MLPFILPFLAHGLATLAGTIGAAIGIGAGITAIIHAVYLTISTIKKYLAKKGYSKGIVNKINKGDCNTVYIGLAKNEDVVFKADEISSEIYEGMTIYV